MSTIWSSPQAVREAIAAGDASSYQNQRTFVESDPQHRATLLSLSDAELAALLPSREKAPSVHRIVSLMNAIALSLVRSGEFHDALRLFDVATTVPAHVDASLYCNALWAVQDDNHHLGVMEDRALAYLERCLPHGRRNPAIFFNAALVRHELGDDGGAIECVRDAVRFGYERLEVVRAEKVFGPLLDDPRFVAAFTDPALLSERRERVMPAALVALKQAEGDWRDVDGAIDLDVYPTFETPEETRAWLRAWTGNDAPPVEVLRVFGQDGTGGKVAIYRTDMSRPLEDEPIVFLGSEGAFGVVARDLADFFVLFAAGLGPLEVVDQGATSSSETIRSAKKILTKHFPDAKSRTVEEALTAAKSAALDFVERIRGAQR